MVVSPSGARTHVTRLDAIRDGEALIDVLHPWLQAVLDVPLSRATARRLIVAGAVRLDGRVARRPGWEVRRGATLEARVDIARLPGGQGRAEVESLPILYEDEDLIAVNKPPGLPTVPTADPGRPSVFALLREQLRARGGGAGIAYLGVHQRLDAETSGVVVFAKRQDANEWLAHAFATRTVVKVYVALTVRPPSLPPETWRVDRPVETAHGEAGRSRGAVTELSLTRVLRRALLVEARPETGRRHQVRIHLAASGLPILGDTRYGGPANIGRLAVPRVMLHAARLTVPRGTTDSRLELSASLPPDFENLLGTLDAS